MKRFARPAAATVAVAALCGVGLLTASAGATSALWNDDVAFQPEGIPLLQRIDWRQNDPFEYIDGLDREVDMLIPNAASGVGGERPIPMTPRDTAGVPDPGTANAELTATLSCTPVTHMTNPVAAGWEPAVDGVNPARGHWLVVASDGRVWSWGANDQGRLGLGTAGAGDPLPQQVRNFGTAVAVAAGARHSLALDDQGNVWAWGDNSARQLGQNLPWSEVHDPRQIPASAFQVNGVPQRVIAVAAGHSHSLALTADGTVWHWGTTPRGGTNAFPTPMPLPQGQRAVAITTSSVTADGNPALHQTSFVVTESGQVMGWGYNGAFNGPPVNQPASTVGVLGVGNGPDPFGSMFLDGFHRIGFHHDQPTTSSIPFGGRPVVAIDTFDGNTLAVTDTGRLWGWGLNREMSALGRTGTVPFWEVDRFPNFGSFARLDWPTPIVENPAILGEELQFVSVSAANGAAITHDGRVFSWGTQSGRNQAGNQFLVPNPAGGSAWAMTGELTSLGSDVVSIVGSGDGSTTNRTTLAVTADGRLHMWGSDWSNGFGDSFDQGSIAYPWLHPLTTPGHLDVGPTIQVRTPQPCSAQVMTDFLANDVDLWLVRDGQRVQQLDLAQHLPLDAATFTNPLTLTFALPELRNAVDGFDADWHVLPTRRGTTSTDHRFYLDSWTMRP